MCGLCVSVSASVVCVCCVCRVACMHGVQCMVCSESFPETVGAPQERTITTCSAYSGATRSAPVNFCKFLFCFPDLPSALCIRPVFAAVASSRDVRVLLILVPTVLCFRKHFPFICFFSNKVRRCHSSLSYLWIPKTIRHVARDMHIFHAHKMTVTIKSLNTDNYLNKGWLERPRERIKITRVVVSARYAWNACNLCLGPLEVRVSSVMMCHARDSGKV